VNRGHTADRAEFPRRPLSSNVPYDGRSDSSVVNLRAAAKFYPQCNSRYLGANVPGKPRVFKPYIGFPAYAEKLAWVVANDYAGFVTRRRAPGAHADAW